MGTQVGKEKYVLCILYFYHIYFTLTLLPIRKGFWFKMVSC